MSEWGEKPRHRGRTRRRRLPPWLAWVPWEYLILIAGMGLILTIGFK